MLQNGGGLLLHHCEFQDTGACSPLCLHPPQIPLTLPLAPHSGCFHLLTVLLAKRQPGFLGADCCVASTVCTVLPLWSLPYSLPRLPER